jgi:hypothetical protein
MAPPPPDSSPRYLRETLLCAAVAAYAFIASFPDVTYTPPGLDGSWRLEISRLALERGFGRDAVFTSGPLGPLLNPTDATWVVVGASLLRFAQQVALAWVIASLVRLRRFAGAAALVAAWTAAFWAGLLFEHGLLLLLPLLALETVRTGRKRWLAAAAALAGAAMMVKTSLAVGAAGVVAVAGAILLWRHGLRAWSALVAAAVAFAVVFLGLAALLLRSPREIPDWLGMTLATVDGYNVAMSSAGRPLHLAVCLGVLALAITAGVWLALRRSPAAVVVALFAVPAFLTFKHAFVRHDIYHEIAFLPFVVAALGVIAAHVEKRLELAVLGGLACLSVAAGVALTWSHPREMQRPPVASVASGQHGLRNLRAWADVPGEIRRQREMIDAVLAADAAPALRSRVGKASVGIIPWELALCRANALRCVPIPTLQLFTAYTASLDDRVAAHFSGPAAPEYVVMDDQGLDGRSVVLDTPATLLSLLSHYERTGGGLGNGRVLLQRRPAPLELAPRTIGSVVLPAGAWSTPPAVNGQLMARVELALSPVGRLRKLLFRIDPVYVEVVYCDGRAVRHRILPDTARNGLLLDHLADEDGVLDAILDRTAGARITRIRLSGPGLRSYRSPVRITWAEIPRSAEGSAACHSPAPGTAGLARLEMPPGKPLLAVDEFKPSVDATGGLLHLKGWAVDPVAGTPAAGLLVEVAGQVRYIPVGRERRDDVAKYFGVEAYAQSGYRGAVALDALPPGKHPLHVKVLSSDGRAFYDDPQRRELEVH